MVLTDRSPVIAATQIHHNLMEIYLVISWSIKNTQQNVKYVLCTWQSNLMHKLINSPELALVQHYETVLFKDIPQLA